MNWIAVGLVDDVPEGTVVPRQVSGTDLAVWRSQSGACHAWGDRCPHRGMRLSHGFVRGETLACIYHGWQYGADSSCTYIPAHPNLTPPATICATKYTCVQKGQVIWVALEPTEAEVPDIGDRQAVRSLDIALSAGDVAERLQQQVSPLLVLGGEHDLAIALQPCTGSQCMVHVFAGTDQDKKSVSRYVENLRTELEAAA